MSATRSKVISWRFVYLLRMAGRKGKASGMLRGFISRLYEGDGTGGGSGGGGGDPTEGFKRLLEKHGSDALRVAELLHRENYQEREQNRLLRQQLAEAQGKVPAEGAIILSKD